jgi:hypothetical protein
MNNLNNKKPLSQKILEEIRKGAPQIPRSHFFIKNTGFWALTVSSILVGGIVISALLFRMIVMTQFEPKVPPSGPVEVLYLVPILWIILLSALIYFAYKATRKTELGYRYKLSTIIVTILFLTVVCGLVFYRIGTGIILDQLVGDHFLLQNDIDAIRLMR